MSSPCQNCRSLPFADKQFLPVRDDIGTELVVPCTKGGLVADVLMGSIKVAACTMLRAFAPVQLRTLPAASMELNSVSRLGAVSVEMDPSDQQAPPRACETSKSKCCKARASGSPGTVARMERVPRHTLGLSRARVHSKLGSEEAPCPSTPSRCRQICDLCSDCTDKAFCRRVLVSRKAFLFARQSWTGGKDRRRQMA